MRINKQEFEKSIYPRLDAELMSARITWQDLALKVKIPLQLLMYRMYGLYDFTVHEAQRIKKAIESDLPLEELFKREGD